MATNPALTALTKIIEGAQADMMMTVASRRMGFTVPILPATPS
jgi:hypothetical protein